ncbi:hypothetical protein ZIOFF_037493 [Zingiber officinale]|uniref:E2 ubiquitin-conjugating enzyme n=1 Tax=Zingiber officinale TaxID=94328 RepID=A0A8J5GG25_ZINOF|nr:hypothetical protein ZIOFF_037493 [Zingiber officinale]
MSGSALGDRLVQSVGLTPPSTRLEGEACVPDMRMAWEELMGEREKEEGVRDFGPPPTIKEIFSPSPALRRRRRSRRLRAHSAPLAGSLRVHSAPLAGSLRVHSAPLAGSLRAHSSPPPALIGSPECCAMGEATGVPICDSVRSGEAISIDARGSPSLVCGRLESLRCFRRTPGGESPSLLLILIRPRKRRGRGIGIGSNLDWDALAVLSPALLLASDSRGFEKMVDVSRVQKELVECNRDKAISGVCISLADGGTDLSHLRGTIFGPVDTPYEGGIFAIDIRLTSTIFFLFFFLIFFGGKLHPNISSQNGAICLDILKDQWSPALTLKTALLSLQALLSAPAPDDPQDAVVAKQYLDEYHTFVSTARYWTEAFAKGSSVSIEEKVEIIIINFRGEQQETYERKRFESDSIICCVQVQKLVDMGFPEDLVRSTLKSVNNDENLALEKLCS